jgi:ribosomal-protein-alanine N-acetyltransferase
VESRINVNAIETERLILRPFTLDDAEAMYAMGSHPDVIRYAGNVPLASVDAARELLANVVFKDYAERGYGRFAVELKSTGKVIGFSGVKFIADLKENELGYRLMPEYWGMGLASESAIASIAFAKDTLGLQRLIGLVHSDNHASANVLRKVGFTLEGKTAFALIEEAEVDVYARAI